MTDTTPPPPAATPVPDGWRHRTTRGVDYLINEADLLPAVYATPVYGEVEIGQNYRLTAVEALELARFIREAALLADPSLTAGA